MKYILTLTLLTFFPYAQEPTKPFFESVFYQNDGKIYANKALPIYLSISTNPDGSDPMVLDTPGNPSDGSPMYFDTNGTNYIRSKWAVDPETKKIASPSEKFYFLYMSMGLHQFLRLHLVVRQAIAAKALTTTAKGSAIAFRALIRSQVYNPLSKAMIRIMRPTNLHSM